ncbi:MAG: acetyl-CoA carboxylase carboxyltransferase subunit beta [Nitrospirae bacterium]|nr:acetyl-CoA carboxylase carboxyltransferase subunit beta [Candidatus Troglogloeales bacterium]
MAWFKKENQQESGEEEPLKIRSAEGLWVKCNNCREIIYRKELERRAKVCPKCQYHFPISIEERIAMVVDEGTFQEMDRYLSPQDPLSFKDTARYKDRLKTYQEKTGQKDAIVMGDGEILNRPVVLVLLNFSFMGGSMGSVVGEKLTRGVERATAHRIPLVVFSASGGARMQEGALSLMQMAKSAAAIARLQTTGVPYISVLTDPTFGGVTASFAMLGDIILAEPKSLIGFAGPRVIEKTIKQQLPAGFQRAEFLLEHGMIDRIVERSNLRETLGRILSFF